MRVLFFPHEQYQPYEYEAANFEVRLPALNCGVVTEYHDFVFQRTLRTRGREAMNREAYEVARWFCPDVVVHFRTWPFPRNENIDHDVIHRIDSEIAPVLTIVFDSYRKVHPFEMGAFSACTGLATLASVHDFIRYRELSRVCGGKPGIATLIGHNVLTELFQPSASEPARDVSFIGSVYGVRRAFLREAAAALAACGIRLLIHGGNFDDHAPHRVGFRGTSWLPPDKYIEAIRSSRICLNIPSIEDHTVQIKGRVFEIMSCGSLCLTDDNADARLLLPADGVVFYTSLEDCIGKIRWLIADDGARRRVARRGHEWYRASFDYRRFWSELVEAVANRAEPPTHPLMALAYANHRARRQADLRSFPLSEAELGVEA